MIFTRVRRQSNSLLLECGAALLLAGTSADAQDIISTFAGGGTPPNPLQMGLAGAVGLAHGPDGSTYCISQNHVYRLNPQGVFTCMAGTGEYGFSGDGGPAAAAVLDFPEALVIDASGNAYISDSANNRIRRVDAVTGNITTIAGNGAIAFDTLPDGDGGLAVDAQLSDPLGIALDSSGNIYFADFLDERIREICVATGIITTVVGSGTIGYSGDGGPAIDAELDGPNGVGFDAAGNMYISEEQNHCIREVSAATSKISTIAGTGVRGYNGDEIPATTAQLNVPVGLAVDSAGNVFIADSNNFRTREVSAATGLISTYAGNGVNAYSGDGMLATVASSSPSALMVDPQQNVYIADYIGARVRVVNAANHLISTIIGDGSTMFSGDGGPAIGAQLSIPNAVAADAFGNVFIADTGNNRLRTVAAYTGVISTIAGNGSQAYSGDGGSALAASMEDVLGCAVDASGNVYLTNASVNVVRKYNPQTGIITTIAGSLSSHSLGDGGQATSASLSVPNGVAVDGAGNVYIADTGDNRVRKVTVANGLITTVAGDGVPGYSGDGGLATAAELNHPSGVAFDSAGNLYIADTNNSRIREVSVGSLDITTIAGTGTSGYSGDNGAATAAELSLPQGVAVEGNGTIYIADSNNSLIREVAEPSGIISTLAGAAGYIDYLGDGGPSIDSMLATPTGVAVDKNANVYIADSHNNRIRVIVQGAAQSMSFATIGNQTYGVAPITMSATASSGLTANFVVVSGPASISGDVLTIMGAGSVSVRAQQGGNLSILPIASVQTLVVAKAPQTITFPAIPNQTAAALVTLQATASSGLPTAFSVVSGPAVVTGNQLSITGAGQVVVAAGQTGNANYLAASPVLQTIQVAAATTTGMTTSATTSASGTGQGTGSGGGGGCGLGAGAAMVLALGIAFGHRRRARTGEVFRSRP